MLYPARVVKIVPYFWNKRCLEAPRPFMIEGFYHMDPRRRVRPGLLPVPQGFTGLPDPTLTARLMQTLLDRKPLRESVANKFIEELSSKESST